jgi:hypothetical protein
VSKPPSTFNARAETVAERPMLRLNPFADRVFKFRDIMEHASSDALARDLGEEPLDEIHPRAGCWGEVELETLLPGEPALHLLCLVRSVIVDDEMQIEADGSLAVDLPEELQVFVCPVARQALRTDATSVHSLAQCSLAGMAPTRFNQALTLRSINNGDAGLAARSNLGPKSAPGESEDRSKEAFWMPQ